MLRIHLNILTAVSTTRLDHQPGESYYNYNQLISREHVFHHLLIVRVIFDAFKLT